MTRELHPRTSPPIARLLSSDPSRIPQKSRHYSAYIGVVSSSSAYASRHDRVDNLALRIAQSYNDALPDAYRAAAEALVIRDQNEEGIRHGQHLGDAFPLADVFVNAANSRQMQQDVERFVHLLFGSPFITPTKAEYSMFLAQAAALRSAQMGRQVGATIVNDDGDIVAVGTNEVPKAGGGLYWSDDEKDGRDHVLGYDSADRMKRQMLAEIIEKLVEQKLLPSDDGKKCADRLVRQALRRPDGFMRGTQLMNVLEYGRPVHAEMAAVTDAAPHRVNTWSFSRCRGERPTTAPRLCGTHPTRCRGCRNMTRHTWCGSGKSSHRFGIYANRTRKRSGTGGSVPREGWLDRAFESVDRARRELPDWVWSAPQPNQTPQRQDAAPEPRRESERPERTPRRDGR